MLYNKYRPKTIDHVIGQDGIIKTLKKSIEEDKLSHSMIFSGIRGTGKTSVARLVAKELNTSDIDTIEIDAASNSGVDDIRRLVTTCKIPPHSSDYKVYIIDEVHMLSNAAMNALLKMLEEPPKHCIFILCTTEKNKILTTILSRCQLHSFVRINIISMITHLKYIAKEENIEWDFDGLSYIAQKSEGSMRDAISLLEACSHSSNATLDGITDFLNVPSFEDVHRVVECIVSANVNECLIRLNTLFSKGVNDVELLDLFLDHFRNLFYFKSDETSKLIHFSDKWKHKLRFQYENLGAALIFKALTLINQCRITATYSHSVRLSLEMTLIQLILLQKK